MYSKDPGWLSHALGSYPPNTPADRLVQLVSHKMLESHYYPTVVSPRPRQKRKGKGKEAANNDNEEDALFDLTATRNRDLIHLNDMFPTIDLAYLRRLLVRSTHSFLYVAITSLVDQSDPLSKPDFSSSPSRAESSLSSLTSSLKSRSGVSQGGPPQRQHPGRLAHEDLLRTPAYMVATLTLLRHQFPDVWSSSIRAIMAENNGSYTNSRRALEALTQEQRRGWLSRTWKSLWGSSKTREPQVQNAELEAELAVHARPKVEEALKEDEKVARELNRSLSGAPYECGCCFGEFAFEDLACCADGHEFCVDCLEAHVKECVYGQAPLTRGPQDDGGWPGSGMGVRCISTEGCSAPFTLAELERALKPDIFAALSDRLGEEALEVLSLPPGATAEDVVRCPFCPYAEVRSSRLLARLFPIARRNNNNNNNNSRSVLSFVDFLLSVVPALIVGILYLSVILILCAAPDLFLFESDTFSVPNGEQALDVTFPLVDLVGSLRIVTSYMRTAVRTLVVRQSGASFRCRRPGCGQASCMLCGRNWYAGHRCAEADGAMGLRLAMERAMSDAIKRTCPQCGLSFTKEAGCNRCTCRCGEWKSEHCFILFPATEILRCYF
jgi:hypothetical protein